MEKEKAKQFALDWIASFNSHDLDAILSHYVDDIEFYSPFIQMLNFNESGAISSKEELRRYFQIGLKTYPDLYFKFHDCFVGINTIVISYTSVNNRLAAEVFQLNDSSKAVKVHCHYTEAEP